MRKKRRRKPLKTHQKAIQNDSALPLKLAEKLAERFNNAEDRAKFMEKIQSRLTHEKPDTEIKIKEINTVVVSKKGLKQDTDLER